MGELTMSTKDWSFPSFSFPFSGGLEPASDLPFRTRTLLRSPWNLDTVACFRQASVCMRMASQFARLLQHVEWSLHVAHHVVNFVKIQWMVWKHDRKTRGMDLGNKVTQAFAFHLADATATRSNCGARLSKTTVEEIQRRLVQEAGARSL